MHRTPHTPDRPSPDRSGGAARITLDRIAGHGRDFSAVITAGRRQWVVACDPSDLQSFLRFQRRAMQQHGLWIDHESQDAHRAAARRREWLAAVGDAFSRGAAA